MAAYYDEYDYPSYWIGRQYEHDSEVVALRAFLTKIKNINTFLDAGSGYGRLTPYYYYRSKKIILSDPSSKLLKIAKMNFTEKKYKFIHSKLENLPGHIRSSSIDVILFTRVLHHMENVDLSFKIINKLLKKRGYLILEFANKQHFKASFREFIKGNLTFPLEIFPKDIGSKKRKRQKTITFRNYHPDDIRNKLEKNGFDIISTRSISNMRNSLIKKYLPHEFTVAIESMLQRPLSFFDFGPSIFILARKKG